MPLTADPDQLPDRAPGTAFEGLVERHRSVVLRVASRVVGEDEADGVAFHRRDRFRGDAPFRAWLLSVACKVGAGRRPPARRGIDGLAP